MAELVLSVLFEAIDRMSGQIEKISKSFSGLSREMSVSEKLGELGSSITKSSLALGAVGGAAAVGIGALVHAAADEAGVLAHVRTAMNDGAATTQHLNEVREASDKLALQGIISTEQLGKAYYIARSNALDHAAALEAVTAATNLVTGTTANATEANAALEQTTRTLTELHNNFGGSMQFAADELAKLQRQYSFRDIGEVTEALGYVQATAKNTGVALTGMNAALAVLSENGIHAGSAGETLNQIITKLATGGAHGRLLPFLQRTAEGGLDLQKSFAALSAAMSKMDTVQRTAFLKSAGFDVRSLRGAEILAANVAELARTQKDLQSATGAAATAAAERLAASDEQFDKLQNSVKVLAETLGSALLPAVTQVTQKISGMVAAATQFLDKHPEFARIAMDVAAIGTTATLATAGLGLIAGGALKIVSHVPDIITFGKGIYSIGSYAVTLARSIDLVSAATTIWTVAQTALDLALSPVIAPILAVVAAAAALAFVGYEIYEHWGGFKAFWVGLWNDVKAIFAGVGKWMYDAGAHILEALGEGLLSGVHYAEDAVKSVGKTIMSYFPHSPAAQGPLRDLNEVDVLAEIIQTIQDNTDSFADALGGALSSGMHAATSMAASAGSFAGTLGGALARGIHGAGPAISRAWEGVKSLVGAGHAAVLRGLMGTESSYGRMLTNPLSSAIGPYQMNRAFRAAFGVTPAAAMDVAASTEVANKVIFERYLPEFGGDMAKALSAWHQGEGWVRRHGVDVAYVNNVIHHMTSTPAALALPMINSPAALAPQVASAPVTLAPQITNVLPTGHASFPGPAGGPPVSPRAAAQSLAAHTTNIHYNPIINGTGMNHRELLGVLRQHSRELGEIVAHGDDRRRRLAFEG